MNRDFFYTPLPQRPSAKPLSKTLGHNVRKLRLDQSLSISGLSFICEISRPLLLKIERGQSDVRLSYVERLADALDVEPLALLACAKGDDGQQNKGRDIRDAL